MGPVRKGARRGPRVAAVGAGDMGPDSILGGGTGSCEDGEQGMIGRVGGGERREYRLDGSWRLRFLLCLTGSKD